MDNIILIGFMGSGKTCIGELLAKKLNYTFCDTDQMIELESSRSIRNIFASEGEEYFREREANLIRNLYGKLNHSVLSVGGGLPMREGNGELLKRLGQIIFLETSKDTIKNRLKGDSTRPLLVGENVDTKIDNLLKVRTPIYESIAHYTLITDHKTMKEVVEEIINKKQNFT